MNKILAIFFVTALSLLGEEPQVVSLDKVEHREKSGKQLAYFSNQDTPFTGKAVIFYANGQKRKELTYKDGKRDGLTSWWFKNGQKHLERNYKDGKREGLTIHWYENGQMEMESNYNNGGHHGVWTKWYENGQLRGRGNSKGGVAHGLTLGWYCNGQKRRELLYLDGCMETALVWKKDGEKCPVTKLEAGNGVMVEYNEEDGTEMARFTYNKGHLTHSSFTSNPSS